MIRPLDTLTLAYTKLRTRKIRTAFTTLIAGLLFGLLLAILFVSSGFIQSVNEFSKEGIGEKYITASYPSAPPEFDTFLLADKPEFIARVEQLHQERTAAKKAEATRLNIPYSPATDDPSPIHIDKESGNKKTINIDMEDSFAIQQALKEYRADNIKPVDLTTYTKAFDVKRHLTEVVVTPQDGTLIPMDNGKETAVVDFGKNTSRANQFNDYFSQISSYSSLALEDDTLSMPYATVPFDPTKATAIPVIVTYSYAERALGLQRLSSKATPAQKVERIREVRQEANNLAINFCYRNSASSALLSRALEQSKEMEKNKNNKDYIQPQVTYQIPDAATCGPTLILRDSRSQADRTQQQNQEEFARKFDGLTDPVEHKLNFQVIGISPSIAPGNQSLIEGVSSMLAANAVPHWQIPVGYFTKLPATLKPEAVFGPAAVAQKPADIPQSTDGTLLTEFNSLASAQAYLDKYTCGSFQCKDIVASPYANNTLIMNDIKKYLDTAVLWTASTISFVAIIILGSMVGRTVADGRRETAVFRSIGAKRIDIASIYLCYTLLLALRIIIFVALLGTVLALMANYFASPQITPDAHIAFSAQNLDKQFYLFGLSSPYLIYLPPMIIGISLLAMIPPMLLGIRRNPIKDMRQE